MVCYENKICKEKINGDGGNHDITPVFALRSTYGKMVCNEKRGSVSGDCGEILNSSDSCPADTES